MTEREWLNEFGDNLLYLMDENRMTQSELSELTGISQATISKYTNKTQMPTVRAIVNISYALDEDYIDLIDFGERIEG